MAVGTTAVMIIAVGSQCDSVDTERLAVFGGPNPEPCPSHSPSTELALAGAPCCCGAPAPVPHRTGDSGVGACSAPALVSTSSSRSFQGSHAELSHEAHDGSLALALRPHRGVRFMMASLRREVTPKALMPLLCGSSGSPTTTSE